MDPQRKLLAKKINPLGSVPVGFPRIHTRKIPGYPGLVLSTSWSGDHKTGGNQVGLRSRRDKKIRIIVNVGCGLQVSWGRSWRTTGGTIEPNRTNVLQFGFYEQIEAGEILGKSATARYLCNSRLMMTCHEVGRDFRDRSDNGRKETRRHRTGGHALCVVTREIVEEN
ncbi:hypothetical protein BD410DRAFT_810210 [Rickenella mellea]|uniref:Uncharacterized protein n=1 Tax=Rickenella mellea TaxID=50990 RepID=A0A4Y7PFL8_9AGAM|nr:hypothetical protein BD410DRAFT_810210 [Rickenella mellea]